MIYLYAIHNFKEKTKINVLHKIEETALKSSFTQAGYVDVGSIKFYPEVREICAGNGCRHYGTSWACPPAIGTLEECRERALRYKNMLLFSKKYELEDSYDFEGMTLSMSDFKKTVDIFEDNLKGVLSDYLLLSNEGCGRCKSCTYPNSPCRFPEKLHHSLEGYGFIVSELAKDAGILYNNGNCTVTFFGALLFNC